MEKAVAVAFRTIMHGPYRDHPSEDSLERFLMNQTDEDELELIETHILACEACVGKLEALELTLQASKMALRDFQAESASRPETSVAKASFGSWLTLPHLSFIGGTAAACVAAILFVSLPRNVELTAYRGAETNRVATWLPLNLNLSARGIPPGSDRIEVVDAQGSVVWQGISNTQGQQIKVRIPRLKSPDARYFVRVYSNHGEAKGNLLREYLIQTKSLF